MANGHEGEGTPKEEPTSSSRTTSSPPKGGGTGGKIMSGLQVLQLAVTIVLAVATFLLNRSNEENKRQVEEGQQEFNQTIKRIETDLALKQDDRAASKAVETLRITLFTHVSTVLEKEKNADRQRLAARSLVTSLLETDDQLRIGLIQALAEGATDKKLSETPAKEAEFRAEEAASLADALKLATAPTKPVGILKSYVVDVFTCEKDGTSFREKALEVKITLEKSTAKPRDLRVLFESVNASPGFRVSTFQIRYSPDEKAAATALRDALKAQGEFALRLVKNDTPNYLSVFVCS